MRSGQTDIGFVWLPVVVADDMEHVVVAEEPIVLAVPEGHELAGRSSLGFAEIVTLPLIALPEQAGDLRDFWLAGHARREPAPVALVAHTPDEALEAVAAGLGAVLLSLGNSVVHAHPGVVFIPVPDLPPARLALVRRAGDDREVTTEALRAVRADGALS